MDEETKKMFDELREELGKNVDAVARVDDIAARVETGETKRSEMESEIKAIRETVEAREKELTEIKRETRLQGMQRDGVHDSRQAREIVGMQMRSLICQHVRQEVPAQFAGETERLRALGQERATLEAGAAGGSDLVPTSTESEILDSVEDVADLVSRSDFQPGLPGKMDMPTLTGRPTLQHKRATVDTNMTASDPSIGVMQFRPEEGYVFFPIDNALILMSPVQLGTFCLNLARDSVIEGLANDLVLADGTAAYNSDTGILNEPAAAYKYSLPAGKKAFQDLEKQDLTAMKKKSLKRGRARGTWLMAMDVLGVIEDMDRQGKTPVITYAQDGTPRVLQNPVVTDEAMPTLEDSKKDTPFIGFGDLATFLVGLVGGIQLGVSDQVYFQKNQTCFRAVINYQVIRKPVKTYITGRTAKA